MININGVTIPTPADYSVSIMDISKAERTSDGTMVLDIIATKRKIEMSWKFLEKQQLSTILNLINSTFFTVVYIDPEEGAEKTGIFYKGDRNCPALDYKNGSIRWKDVKFNIVER